MHNKFIEVVNQEKEERLKQTRTLQNNTISDR